MQASDQGDERIQEIIVTDNTRGLREISRADTMFLALYNHQVRKLQPSLGNNAKAGSVQKFEGQETPIVFLSMCSSNANESPRGSDFLLNIHRLKVTVCRAQVLVIVVARTNLVEGELNGTSQLRQLNLMTALFEG